MAYRLSSSRDAERSERLARLVYELLDAHADTAYLAREYRTQLQWRTHLS